MRTKSSTASSLLTKPNRHTRKTFDRNKLLDFDHAVIVRRIEKAGYEVFCVTALSNRTGNQYRLLGGGMVIVYNTGTVVIAGKLSEEEKVRLQRKLRRRSH